MPYSEENDKKYRQELEKEIARLKKEKNAIILAHNYQREEIQDIADIVGDSLQLARAATKVDADIIEFCGVRFMAESASILNPDKKVLLPVKEAGCPLADMISPEKLKALKAQHPDAACVCYVNSSAEVKAESDVACTSSNAIEVVRSLPNKRIIFVPDENLAKYVQSQVPEKEIIMWKGFCPTHIRLSEEEVIQAKKEHPKALFLAHPECKPEVLKLADQVCSTGGMFKYARASKAKEFIIGTESGMLYRLKKENPDKNFYLPSEHLVCANMKLTTLGWIAHSLELEVNEIRVPEEIRVKAKKSLDRMLEITYGK
ncbi:MAG: quinolinate synthase NadA [Candidatus Omnitrophota bacterium]|nr:MAG: quinolinate synthase NadA [Candidatus Omnitrophota bacterium]